MKNSFLRITTTPIALFLCLFLTGPSANAWRGNDIAVNVTGGISSEQAIWMATDGDGNIYTAGYFQDTVDFDPSGGMAILTSAGLNDMFISKFDSSGNYLWAKRIGSTNSEAIASIAVDKYGNIFATGDLVGIVDFDPGDGIANLISEGGTDGFVLKLNTDGNFVWAKQFGGSGFNKGVFIAVDQFGNVAITGAFSESVDFDPGAETANLKAMADWDIFILKLDSSGNYLWSNRRGGTGKEVGDGIFFDSDGNIYASGYFNGTVDFDPSEAVSNLTSAGSTDIFISKFDSSGNYLWANRIGGTSNDYINPIGMDSNGNIFVSGLFKNTVDFDPGAGTANLASKGGYDIFISKFDSSGNYLWAKGIGGTSDDTSWSIASDRNGNIVTTGKFAGTADFNPDVETTNLTSAGSNDIFVLKLDSSGNFLWVKQIGGTGDDGGQPIAFDSSGNIYVSGYFSNMVDFDLGADASNFTSNGDYDMFTLKLNSSGNALVSSMARVITQADIAAAALVQTATEKVAALAKQEAEKQVERANVIAAIKDAQELTVDSFAKAQIPGINASNIGAVQVELLALPEDARSDIKQVLKVARKYEAVGIIASDTVNRTTSHLYVEIGLIPADSKNKTSLVNAVKRLKAEDRINYESIKLAITAEQAVIAKRAERLAAVMARGAARSLK